MSVLKTIAFLSIASIACFAQGASDQTQNSQNSDVNSGSVPQTLQGTPVSPGPNGPLVYTPSMTLSPNGPVYGNPAIQANSTEAVNAANADAKQSSDYGLPGRSSESQPSLGDVARQYREQRAARKAQEEQEQQQEAPAKTYTDDDLKKLETPSRDHSENLPPAVNQEVTPAASDISDNSISPVLDQSSGTHPTEKPSAAHQRSVVQEVEQQVQQQEAH